MAILCEKCAQAIPPKPDNRLPPWCPHCGADLKRAPAQADPRPSPREPSPQPASAPQETIFDRVESPPQQIEVKHDWHEPMRFRVEWFEPRAFQRALEGVPSPHLRWFQALILVLFLMFLGHTAIQYVVQEYFPKLPSNFSLKYGLPVLGIFGLALLLWLTGATPAWYVELGPKGISRTRAVSTGHHVMVTGWEIPWYQVERLVYMESYPLGNQFWRVLVVHTVNGEQRMIGIAKDVSARQLSATCNGWNKHLEMSSSPDQGVVAANK
jgi:hypothetical protein